MSFFQAEIKGKVGLVEDSLTAKAFGVLDVVDRTVLLKLFLEQCGIKLTDDEVRELQVKFWEWQGNTEPDVILESPSKLIYIEAKLESPLNEEQLLKEYRDGMAINQDFHLIAITREPLQPKIVDKAIKSLSQEFGEVNICWTRWHDLHSLLKKGQKNISDLTGRKIAEELIYLFESKGLKTFDGFGKEIDKISLMPFFQFFEDLSLFANEIASKSGLQLGRFIIRGYQSGVVDWYDDWFSTWIAFSFWDEKWEQGTHNQIALRIDLSEEKPGVSLGYELSFKYGWAINKNILNKNLTELSVKVPTVEGLKVAFKEPDLLMDTFDSTAFQGNLKKTNGGVSFEFRISLDELYSKDILENTLSKLEQLRDFANKLKLLVTSDEKEEYNRMKAQENQEEVSETSEKDLRPALDM